MTFATGRFSSHESHVCILDLISHQVSTLPGSDGKFAPQWSPDGHFISAPSLESTSLYIFDMKTQRWLTLNTGFHGYSAWSSDSHYIYFLRIRNGAAILRIPATGGEANMVVDLKGFPLTGTGGLWLGLDPTDAPLMLRDVSTTDVYALTLEQK